MTEQQQPDPSKEAATLGTVVLSVVVYLAGVVGCIVAMTRATPDQLALIYPLAIPLFSGGVLKLINIVQNYRTDRKVVQDLATTRDVHRLVNGGLKDRVKQALAEVLAEQQADQNRDVKPEFEGQTHQALPTKPKE